MAKAHGYTLGVLWRPAIPILLGLAGSAGGCFLIVDPCALAPSACLNTGDAGDGVDAGPSDAGSRDAGAFDASDGGEQIDAGHCLDGWADCAFLRRACFTWEGDGYALDEALPLRVAAADWGLALLPGGWAEQATFYSADGAAVRADLDYAEQAEARYWVSSTSAEPVVCAYVDATGTPGVGSETAFADDIFRLHFSEGFEDGGVPCDAVTDVCEPTSHVDGVVTSADGPTGGRALYLGSGSVTVTPAAALDVLNTAHTFSLWFSRGPAAMQDDLGPIIDVLRFDGTLFTGFRIYNRPDEDAVYVDIRDITGASPVDSLSPEFPYLEFPTWHHIGWSATPQAADEMTFCVYIDGQPGFRGGFPTCLDLEPGVIAPVIDLWLGKSNTSPASAAFVGWLDEFRVIDGARPPEWFAREYARGQAVNGFTLTSTLVRSD